MVHLTKREFLKLGGAAGAFAAAGVPLVHAAAPKVMVNSYGGVYETAVRENFVAHYMKLTGNEADTAADIPSAALSKIRATMPTPDYDLFIATSNDTIRAIELDLVEEIDASKLPNLSAVPEVYRNQWKNRAVSFSYGIIGFLYDTRKISNPPTTWVEFVERTIKGEFGRSVALPSATAAGMVETCIWPIMDAFGGSVTQPDAGFDKLREMKPYITKYTADFAEVLQLISTGEIAISPYVDGRAWTFVEQNPWANFVVPKKGGVFSSSQIMKVKNSPQEAWQLMDAFFAKEPAEGFTETILYPVTTTNVEYSDRMKARLTSMDDVRYAPSFELYEHTASLIERWNKEVGG